MLSTLFVLDIMWMKMIFKMLMGILRLEVRGDIRDSKETRTKAAQISKHASK